MSEHPHQVHAQLPAPAADYAVSLQARGHRFVSDEPQDKGGHDVGARPFELALAGLASCTAITIRMYAQRKQWPLKDVRVELTHDADDVTYRMNRKIELVGDLTAEQKQYLLGIANKCPIHRALHKKFEISTVLS